MKIKLPVVSDSFFSFEDANIIYDIELEDTVLVKIHFGGYELTLKLPDSDISVHSLESYLSKVISQGYDTIPENGYSTDIIESLFITRIVLDTLLANEQEFKAQYKKKLKEQQETEENRFISELNTKARDILGNYYVFQKVCKHTNTFKLFHRRDKNYPVLIVDFDTHKLSTDYKEFNNLSPDKQCALYELLLSYFKINMDLKVEGHDNDDR